MAFPGLSINGFINSPSAGIVFVTLKPFEERASPDLSGMAIAQKLQQKYAGIARCHHRDLPAAAGAGPGHHRRLQAAGRRPHRSGRCRARPRHAGDPAARRQGRPRWPACSPASTIGVPQLYADLDRTKAQQLGVDMQDVFDTMQIYLGSIYVNDFNRFGRTYEVIAQADTPFRSTAGRHPAPEDPQCRRARWCRSARSCSVSETTGPDSAMRYNGFPRRRSERRGRRPAIPPARRRPRSRRF